MADLNVPAVKHLHAAGEHLKAGAARRHEHHQALAEHLRLLRELHPYQPKPPTDQEASS